MSKESIQKGAEKRSKVYYLIDPNGKRLVVKNLSEFCRENNLDQRNMSKMYCGLQKTSKGYKRDGEKM